MNIKTVDILKINDKTNVSETIVEDMCLQYLKDKILYEDNLYDRFIEVITHPSVDIAILSERRAIFNDFVTYGNLARDILKFCEEAEDIKKKINNVSYGGSKPKEKLKDYVSETIPLLELTEQFGRLFYKKFESKTLTDFKIGSMKPIEDEINKLQNVIKTNCLTLDVDFTDGLKLKEAIIYNTDKLNIKPNYKKDKITKEYVLTDTDIIDYKPNFILGLNVEDIASKAILHLCSVISHITGTLNMFYRTLKQDVYFYIAALKIKKHMEDNNLPYCFPELLENACGITAEDVYNYPLAVFSGKEPVKNNIDCDDGGFLIVTGLNQGGKTTFLRSIGIAQLFAQAGLMVPAVKYNCPVFGGIISHFPKEEDDTLNFGKLAEELSRLRNELPIVTGGGLVLLNESFATTTEKEGTIIAVDVLRALSKTQSSVIFVTHLYELAVNIDKLNDSLFNNQKAVNYVTKIDSDFKAIRSYKIVKGEPIQDMQIQDMII